jgi:fluoride exporter
MPQFSVAIAVLIGGAIGSLTRLLISFAITSRVGPSFPVGTLIINITGSALLGFIMRFVLDTTAIGPAITPAMRAFLTTGLCGGYTTFSTFTFETFALYEERLYGRAALYVGLSVVLGLAATFGGFAAAHGILASARSR